MKQQKIIPPNDPNRAMGIAYGLLAFTTWGFLPLYWKMLDQIPATEILAHRIFGSLVFVTIILLFTKEFSSLKGVLTNRKLLFPIFISSIILSFNWGIFIWGVNSGYVVEVSMGYYINPLVVVTLGILVLKEKCSFWQFVAIGLASIGVIIMTVQYGRIPWLGLFLAVSFALYGLSKKLVKVESLPGLAIETALVAPFALAFIIFKQIQGTGAIGVVSMPVVIALFGAGIATAAPLLWFANATKRVELSMVGFMQYIAPTINLYLGIFVFHEPFTKIHLVSFSFIWTALLIYSVSKTSFMKKLEPTKKEKAFQT